MRRVSRASLLASSWIETARIARALEGAKVGLVHALRWVAHHTGAPVLVVAAVGLVLSFRLARFAGRAARFSVEVALALALLIVATRLGWIRW
jgi:hypothetical protein